MSRCPFYWHQLILVLCHHIEVVIVLQYSRFVSYINNKKAVLSQRWPRNVPHNMGAQKIFGTSWLRTGYTFPKIFHVFFVFQLTLWMCVQNLKSVALPVPEYRGRQKIGAVPGYAHTLYSPTPSPPPPKKKNYMPTIQTIYPCALVFPRFSIAVLSGGREPPILGKGRP